MTKIRTVADLRRLQYFVAVARERNFTRAAERLHIAQPALSRQVRLLEQELGVELMHRTTHEFALTEAGEYLLACGPAVLAAADELWRTVRTYGTGERGVLRLAYGASASYETAPRLLQAVGEREPAIEVTTEVKTVGDIVAGVSDGSLDVGLVRCPPPTAGLEIRPVRHERQGVLMRRDHRLASGLSVTLAELGDETLLLHPREANPGHYDAVLELYRSHGVEPPVLLRTLSFELAYSPILRGDAVAIVGESSGSGLPDELCWRALSPEASLEVSLVFRRPPRSAAVARMLDVAKELSGQLGWI